MRKNDFHDPSEYIRGLQQVLVSDKKRIGFLFGAGTSLASKDKKSLTVPAIGKLTGGFKGQPLFNNSTNLNFEWMSFKVLIYLFRVYLLLSFANLQSTVENRPALGWRL